MNRTRVAASALIVALAFAAPAQSAPPGESETASRVVRYGDLDLATEEGVKALDRRLASTIRSLCRQFSPYVPHQAESRERCREEARQAIEARRSAAISTANRTQVSRVD